MEFKGLLDLSSGSLSIVGATELVIGNVVIASGNAVLRVDALTLAGLISCSAAARLELAGAGTASGVTVGGGAGAAGLTLGAAQLAALQGFGTVQIGRNDQGATAVDLATLNVLVTPHLSLAGGSLAVQGGSTGPHAGVQLLDLAAAQDLTLTGTLALAAAGADVRASAGGALRMAADAVLATQAGEVMLQAGGDLRLGRVDTRVGGAAGGAAAAVLLASTGGTISETLGDAATDVYAALFTLRGHGPALAAGASEAAPALDVQATALDVDAPRGTVLRDSISGGHTAFNLLDGSQLYQQLIALGTTSRQPSVAPAAAPPATGTADAADAWAWLNAVRPLQDSRTAPLVTAAPTLSALLATPARDAATAGVFEGEAAPLRASQLAALLSADAAAPAVAEPVPDPARFRVWSEELLI